MKAVKNKAKAAIQKVRKEYGKVVHGGCCVLLYHRVTNLSGDPQLLAVSPEHFEAHLKYLKDNYQVLTVREFCKLLESGERFPKNSVLLTFDDGYADNYLEALPILEKHQMQALFYIATGTLGTKREYWWDAVERIVLLSGAKSAQKQFQLNDRVFNLHFSSEQERKKTYEDLLPVLRKIPSVERDRIIDELAVLFNAQAGRETHRAMTFDELNSMHASESAVIGVHTHGHPSLGALSAGEQLAEIKTSKTILEEKLGVKLKHFSYPFGTYLDYNDDTIQIVKELGFEFAAANYPDLVNKASNRFSFPRFLVRDWDTNEFSKQLNSFFK